MPGRIAAFNDGLGYGRKHSGGDNRSMGTISSPLLVGRDQELALLEGSLAHVLGGEAAIVVIDGDAGVGKSRLVEALPLARRRAAAASLSADA